MIITVDVFNFVGVNNLHGFRKIIFIAWVPKFMDFNFQQPKKKKKQTNKRNNPPQTD